MGLFKKSAKKSASKLVDRGFDLYMHYNYEEAIEYFDKALAIDPDCIDAWGGKMEAWFGKGELLIQLEKYEEAIECFDKALAIDNSNCWECVKRKEVTLLFLARYEEAVAWYDHVEHAVGVITDEHGYTLNYYDYFYKGLALGNLRRYEEAIECFDKALEMGSVDKDKRDKLIETYKKDIKETKGKKITERIDMDGLKVEMDQTQFRIYTYMDILSFFNESFDDKTAKKALKYFDEFERAPRITERLVIEFEDFLDCVFDQLTDASEWSAAVKERIMNLWISLFS